MFYQKKVNVNFNILLSIIFVSESSYYMKHQLAKIKRINKLSSLLCLSLLGTFSYAQTKWIQGNIIIDHTDEKAEGVYVTNKRTNYTTKSNFLGIFFIEAQENDTLQFTSSWYENRNLILRPKLFKKNEIVVHLAIETINLSEALITKKLTGILEKDVVLGKKEDDLTRLYKILKVNPDTKQLKDTTALKAGLLAGDITLTHIDVGRIYDIFSGDLRKRKALIDYESKAAQIARIRAYYGDNYFKIDLNIPSYKINEFILTALVNTNNTHHLSEPNYFALMPIFSNYSSKYLDDLFKNRIYKEYKPDVKEIKKIDEKELYINVPLDSIPKD